MTTRMINDYPEDLQSIISDYLVGTKEDMKCRQKYFLLLELEPLITHSYCTGLVLPASLYEIFARLTFHKLVRENKIKILPKK